MMILVNLTLFVTFIGLFCCLSCGQNLLNCYPPNHVLSALEYLASIEQKELEEKVASLDVTQDVTALR